MIKNSNDKDSRNIVDECNSHVMLSICLTVYNQIDLVRECLTKILQYPSDDIEVVVSDDCSQDDISGLVRRLGDSRVRYFRNESNLGHDRNILAGMRHCHSNFVFLLRSRDCVCPDKIPAVLHVLSQNPDSGYFFFSCVNDLGNRVIELSNKKYRHGREAIKAHQKLLVHPSGSIYNKKYLDFAILTQAISDEKLGKLGFVVHQLIRMQLAILADFVTSDITAWVYADGLRAKDVAVNSSPKHISVYAPEYALPRYECEMKFVGKYLPRKFHRVLVRGIISQYYKQIVFDFKYNNVNSDAQRHYNFQPIEFSVADTRNRFVDTSMRLIDTLFIQEKDYLRLHLLCMRIREKLVYPIKACLVRKVLKRRHAATIIKYYKRV